MASDFYQKTLTLYEEFRQRELHYLSTERSLNRDRGFKNSERNLPLEQYLQKITERERESEKMYSETMKKMEEMDQRAELITLKIEKLQMLRENALSSAYFNAAPSQDSSQSKIGSNLQFYYAPDSSLNTVNEPMPKTLAKPIYHSNSTQTDSIITCKQCNIPISLNQFGTDISKSPVIEDADVTLATVKTSIKSNADKLEFTKHFMSENILEAVAKESLPDLALESGNNATPVISNQLEENQISTFNNNSELSKRNENVLVSNNKLSQDKHIADEASDSQKNTPTDVSRSKSDDESMNHEFDFLESDGRRLPTKDDSIDHQSNVKKSGLNSVLALHNFAKASPATDIIVLSKGAGNINVGVTIPVNKISSIQETDNEIPQESVSKKSVLTGKVQETLKPENVKGKELLLDSASDSSFNPLGPQTPSAQSEKHSDTEDSSSGKNVPLTSTAAYQVLLGKVPVSQRALQNKKLSESDSEDEAENALSAVIGKRTSIVAEKPLEDQKVDQRKKCIVQVNSTDLKGTRRSSTIPTNKSQSKLSKSTRKVLGLDTSSGSEVEPEILAKKKIDAKEDSDEFDFYD